jgi:MarR-like DNA-binding transcriptional regulator SgrR of sgrS sRNA
MEVEAYYHALRKHYSIIPEDQAFTVTMDELTEVLLCTRRNVQLLIQKMSESGYIHWIAGRGRGNRSQMIFRTSVRELVMAKAKELVELRKINEAWRLLESLGEPYLKQEFTAWLYPQFGVSQGEDELDVLRFPFYRSVPHLDPAFVFRRTEAHWMRQIFNTLVVYSAQDQRLMPQLAHAWESNADKTRWVFHLRKGVRFHHGKLLTAGDVAYSFCRMMEEAEDEWIASMLQDIRVLGKHDVMFVLNKPNQVFPHLIGTERFSIVPEDIHTLQRAESFATLPIGTGPFRIVRNNESMLILEAHEAYFQGCPHLDQIEMWVWPNYEDQTVVSDREKDVQILYSKIQIEKGSNPRLSQLEQGSAYLSFNQRKPGVMKDVKFRQAIHLALDRQRMVNDLGGIRQQPSEGFIWNGEERRVSSGSDEHARLSEAKRLLAATAYAGERLTLYTYELQSNEQDARWIQAACRAIGVHLELVVLPIEQLTDESIIAQSDMIFAAEVLGEQPDITLMEMYMIGNGYIRNHRSDQEKAWIDGYISRCLMEEDAAARMVILDEIQEQLKRDYRLLFLYHTVQVAGHHASLNGITLNAWGKIDYKDVWVRRHADFDQRDM